MKTMDTELAATLIHSANERIPVDDLELGVDMLRSAAQSLLARMTDAADALVVFGITGDLARRSTLPALYCLSQQGLLTCPVIGVGRRPVSERRAAGGMRRRRSRRPRSDVDEAVLAEFLARVQYIGGDAEAEEDPLYDRLRAALAGLAASRLLPRDAAVDVRRDRRGARRGGSRRGASRLVVEKPFGTDLASARELNQRLTAIFPEERLFRIDHFLGKEPVQDIMYLRFANALFEPIWNREHVDVDPDHDGRGLRRRGSRARSTTRSARYATSSRTTSCRCSRSSRWSRRRATTTRFRAAARTSSVRCRRVDPREAVRGQYAGYRDDRGRAAGTPTRRRSSRSGSRSRTGAGRASRSSFARARRSR